jgi:hypothetical protein
MNKLNFRDSRGFAALGVAIAVLVIIALGGGAMYAAKKANDNGGINATSTAEVEGQGNLRALLAMGKNLKCDFERAQGDSDYEGTVYLAADGRMRGDFETDAEGPGEVDSHMVNDGQYVYIWSDALENQGFKMKVSATSSASASGQAGVSLDETVEYDCEEWNVDADQFELPAGVTFTDAASMGAAAAGMNAGANANVNANLGTGANVDAGTGLRVNIPSAY